MNARDFLDNIKRNREKEYYVIDIRDLMGLEIDNNGYLVSTKLNNNNQKMYMLLKLTLDGDNRYYFKSVYTNGEINIPNTLSLDCEQLLYNFEIDTIELNSNQSISREYDRQELLRNSLCVNLENVKPLVRLSFEERIDVERINNNPTEIIEKINRLKEQSTNNLVRTLQVNKQLTK